MSFPAKGGPRRFPVEGCPGELATRTAMRVHFVHRHVHNTVVMLEEGNLPLPRCPRCDLQVTRKALNGRYLGTLQCKKGAPPPLRPLLTLQGPQAAPIECLLVNYRSHRGHRGRGRLPSSSINTVSCTCRCMKCTRIAVLDDKAPGHPVNGHRLGPPFSGNDILYVLGPPSAWGVHSCRRAAAFPCQVIR